MHVGLFSIILMPALPVGVGLLSQFKYKGEERREEGGGREGVIYI